MADLVSSLETAIRSAMEIASKLRSHVERIDEYMSEAAKQGRQNQVIHCAMPRAALRDESEQELTIQRAKTAQTGDTLADLQRLQVAPGSYESDRGDASLYSTDVRLAQTDIDSANVPWDVDFQFQLPDELFLDWLPNLGQGDVFTFLG
jgi:hypothetical protein